MQLQCNPIPILHLWHVANTNFIMRQTLRALPSEVLSRIVGSLTDNQAKIFSLRGSLTDTLGTHFVQTKFASFAPFIIENNLELVFNRPPSSLDTFQFTFQFFDSDDNIFETSTEPFIVTP